MTSFELNARSIADLFTTNHAWLEAYAESQMGARLRRRLCAADILQSAFITASECQETFAGETEEDAIRWVVAIVYNEIRNSVSWHVKTMQRAVNREQAANGVSGGEEWSIDFAGRSEAPSHRPETAEIVAIVEREIDLLPALQAKSLLFRYRDGLSMTETADALETTTMAVDGLTRRGLKLVRERLADRLESLVD